MYFLCSSHPLSKDTSLCKFSYSQFNICSPLSPLLQFLFPYSLSPRSSPIHILFFKAYLKTSFSEKSSSLTRLISIPSYSFSNYLFQRWPAAPQYPCSSSSFNYRYMATVNRHSLPFLTHRWGHLFKNRSTGCETRYTPILGKMKIISM